MSVNRSRKTSRSEHGNEAVPTRSEGSRTTSAQGHAHAGVRRGTGRSGTYVGSQSANNIELGQKAGRRPAGVAAQAVGTSQRPGRGTEEAAGRRVAGGCGGQQLSDRTMDPGAGSQVDRARVWGGIQHGQRLAYSARVGLLQPTSGGARDPARRSGHQAVAQQALAGAKKSAVAKGAPSSSSTKAD